MLSRMGINLVRAKLKRTSKKQKKKDYELRKIRPKVVERDKGRCLLCGAPYAELHHIKFRSQGGKHTERNLCCLCWRCHRVKVHGEHAKEYRQILRSILSEKYGYDYGNVRK